MFVVNGSIGIPGISVIWYPVSGILVSGIWYTTLLSTHMLWIFFRILPKIDVFVEVCKFQVKVIDIYQCSSALQTNQKDNLSGDF